MALGDLDERIGIVTRDIQPPTSGTSANTQLFGTPLEVWSSVRTVNSDDIFDGANLSAGPTHEFTIRFIAGLTSESWIKYRDENYRILDIQNWDERREFMVLAATKKGAEDLEINQ